MIAIGRLALDMLGSGTSVGGAPCTPTSPASTSVVIGPGAIYSSLPVDTTTYGSLPPNAQIIGKQGILAAPITLACPPPVTSEFSINYLIEGAFNEADVDAQVLPFVNSANPAQIFQPIQGPNNSGASQPTIRQDQFIVQAKAGTQAATGTQTTPAVDSGFVPLYVVTIAFGQATITAANISVAPGAPFITATALDALTEAVANTLYLTPATANTLYLPMYAITAAEAAVGTPSNLTFPPGNPRRWGAVGNGTNDDTTAVQRAINTSPTYIGQPGDIYGVTTVTFPGNQIVRFNGSQIRGIATGATSAAVVIQGNNSDYYDYSVNLTGINGRPTPNQNYTTATWWSNNAGTQFNTFFGCYHQNAVRALVYGQLPGNAATTTIQSENKIFGWQTEGVSNPFFGNSIEGFIHFVAPIFFRDASTWTTPTLPSTAASFENESGQLFIEGGEIVFSNSTVGNGCLLNDCTIVGAYWEGACPALVIGGNVQIIGGNYQIDPQVQSAFAIQAGLVQVIGESGQSSEMGLVINDMVLRREAGAGATDNTPMIDASAAGAFTIELNNTESFEWAWRLAQGNAQLVKPNAAGTTTVRYNKHRLNITASDPNVYVIESPIESMLSDVSFDHLAYTSGLMGWQGTTSASGSSMSQDTTLAGPPGYSNFSVHVHATGQITATSAGGAAVQVHAGELYWASAWVQIASGASGNTQFGALLQSITGGGTVFLPIADVVSIGTGVWTFVQGPIAVPANFQFLSIGLQCTGTADMFITDARLRRAS
jgi:hypothetical protein